MKKSLQSRLVFFLAGLIAMVMLFTWVMNSLFLERYYVYSKKQTLEQNYLTINNLYNLDSASLALELEKLQSARGLQLVIFNRDFNAVYFDWQDTMRMSGRQTLIPGVPGLLAFVLANEPTGTYEIYHNYDKRLNSHYVDLLGRLDNGLFVLLRTPLQSITESVAIANRFMLFTGMISFLIAGLLGLKISQQVTQPIKELNGIAKDMANLDFSRKYEVKTDDEVGSLGNSINTLSGQLEQTIHELKQKNEQLEMDIQYISKVDEKRKEFMSNISHELKTPIALIQGYAEGLQEKVVRDETDQAYYYHVIIDEAERMNLLVRKLMTLNNLESGHDDLLEENFDIVALAQSILQRGQRLATTEDITYHFEAPEEALVFADEFLIEEVIFNYLTNALHHVKEVEGLKQIKVMITNVDKKIKLSIYNTGDQILADDRELIWESFYKVDKSRSRTYGGNGLGLAVVKAAMERHHSAYGIENWDLGVSFWFELPIATSIDNQSEKSNNS
jgi:signal transduction histidine kinase